MAISRPLAIFSGAGCPHHSLERAQSGALVRAFPVRNRGSGGRRRYTGDNADPDFGWPLCRQAESACLDEPEQRAALCGRDRSRIHRTDAANAALYARNAMAYKARIAALDAPFRARFAAIPEPSAGSSPARGASAISPRLRLEGRLYLADQCRPAGNAPANAAHHRPHAQQQVGAIFSESTISDEPAKRVAEENGRALWRRAVCRTAFRRRWPGPDLS